MSSPPVPSRQEIEDQVARILSSPGFAKSDRMARFLKFIAERSVEGRAEELKEYSIALEVFDKGDSFDPRIDPTVRGEARRLRAKLAEYYETAQDPGPVRIELPKGAYVPVFRRQEAVAQPAVGGKRAWLHYAGAIVLVLLAAAIWWFARAKPGSMAQRSIAVLPFENLSADPANEYFSDGLTEEILNALANAPGYKVVARTSSFAFKGKHEDVRSIGKKLNVALVLEGTVRKDGDHLRITPQLINAADGYHVWSAEFEREWKDIFAVQQEIATAIVTKLGGKLGPNPQQPVDAETYRLYLEGLFHFNQWNGAGMQQAIPFFERAIARDPKYAPAHAALAGAYGLLAAFGADGNITVDLRAKARRASLRAIEIDPNCADGWLSLAPHLAEDFDWAAAESAFRKALDLAPNSPNAHAWYSELYLSPMKRLDEALRESKKAAELDPLSPYTLSGVGIRYYFLKQYDPAIAWAQKALAIEPRFGIARATAVNAYIEKGDAAGARRFYEGVTRGQAVKNPAIEAQLFAAEGNRAEARKALDGLTPHPDAECLVAGTQVLLGDPHAAIAALNRAVDSRSACFQVVPVDPRFERLHSTPEFGALMAKMKLSPGR